jgi:hypothetical protein
MSETAIEHLKNREITAQIDKVMDAAGYIVVGHCDVSLVAVESNVHVAEVIEIQRVQPEFRDNHEWTHQFSSDRVINEAWAKRQNYQTEGLMDRSTRIFFRKPGLADVVFERAQAHEVKPEGEEAPKAIVEDRPISPADLEMLKSRLDDAETSLQVAA